MSDDDDNELGFAGLDSLLHWWVLDVNLKKGLNLISKELLGIMEDENTPATVDLLLSLLCLYLNFFATAPIGFVHFC